MTPISSITGLNGGMNVSNFGCVRTLQEYIRFSEAHLFIFVLFFCLVDTMRDADRGIYRTVALRVLVLDRVSTQPTKS